MARLRAALALTAILFPALAFAGSARIRLVAPVAETALRGGENAVVSWEADALPAGAEEWEAFLSIDGGRHYSIRITPHLNIDLHRAMWTVPNITAGDVRMLLRFGDERNESEVEVPSSFRIDAPFSGGPLWPAASASVVTGEEARRGDGGVTAWVAGDRDGGRSHLVTASLPEIVRGAAVRSQIADGDQPATMQRVPIATPSYHSTQVIRIAHPRPVPRPVGQSSSDVLRLSNRMNI